MDNQQAITPNFQNLFNELKILNKLGASFFIMFIIGTFLPLVDLGEYVEETISLYFLTEPTILLIFAFIGCVIFISGISQTAARLISITFIVFVFGSIFSQLYDIYDLAREARELRGRTFEFKHFVDALEDSMNTLPRNLRRLDYLVSPASVLLCISFIGIIGCMVSPRYKTNNNLRAILKGESVESIEADISSEKDASQNTKTNFHEFISKASALFKNLIVRIFEIIQLVYQVVAPLVSSLLEKSANFICEKQPHFEKQKVKMVLTILLALLVFWLIF